MLSPEQNSDIKMCIEKLALSNVPPFAKCTNKVIASYRFANLGFSPEQAELHAQCDQLRILVISKGSLKAWTRHVNKGLRAAEKLRVRRCKGLPWYESGARFAHAYKVQLDGIAQTMRELNIASPSGEILESESWRVWNLDEKSYDS